MGCIQSQEQVSRAQAYRAGAAGMSAPSSTGQSLPAPPDAQEKKAGSSVVRTKCWLPVFGASPTLSWFMCVSCPVAHVLRPKPHAA